MQILIMTCSPRFGIEQGVKADGSVKIRAVDDFTRREGVAISLTIGADLDGARAASIAVSSSNLNPDRSVTSAAEAVAEGDAVAAVDLVRSGEEEAGLVREESFSCQHDAVSREARRTSDGE